MLINGDIKIALNCKPTNIFYMLLTMDSNILLVIDNSTGGEFSAKSVLEGNTAKFSFERMQNAHSVSSNDEQECSVPTQYAWCDDCSAITRIEALSPKRGLTNYYFEMA